MSQTPIDKMLDEIEYQPIKITDEAKADYESKGELYATHEGVFRLADREAKCYVLSNGARVFDEEGVCNLFGVQSIDELGFRFNDQTGNPNFGID